mgnify:CR=1 FL=1
MIPQTNVYVPPDVSTVKTLNLIAGILTIIVLIFALIGGSMYSILLFVPNGMHFILYFIYTWLILEVILDIFLIWLIFSKINSSLDRQEYIEAKNSTLIATIIGFIFGSIIVGIILLIAYLKYDDIIRNVQQYYLQQSSLTNNPK